jgi:hypothetical protein
VSNQGTVKHVMLCHCHNVLASPCLNEHTGDNLTTQGQKCRVDVATSDSLCGAHTLVCVLACHGEATIMTFFLLDEVDKGEHSDLFAFQYSSWNV